MSPFPSNRPPAGTPNGVLAYSKAPSRICRAMRLPVRRSYPAVLTGFRQGQDRCVLSSRVSIVGMHPARPAEPAFAEARHRHRLRLELETYVPFERFAVDHGQQLGQLAVPASTGQKGRQLVISRLSEAYPELAEIVLERRRRARHPRRAVVGIMPSWKRDSCVDRDAARRRIPRCGRESRRNSICVAADHLGRAGIERHQADMRQQRRARDLADTAAILDRKAAKRQEAFRQADRRRPSRSAGNSDTCATRRAAARSAGD